MKQISKEILKIFVGLFVLNLSRSFASGFDAYYQNMMWWVFCGLPYGLPKLRTWLYVRNGDVVSTVMVLLLNFFLAGLIGGVVFAWTMIKSILNIVRLILSGILLKS